MLGCGCDICDQRRFRKRSADELDALCTKILSTDELEQLASMVHPERRIAFIAGRFAAKEAFSKALGVGISADFSFLDLSIDSRGGKPQLRLSEKLAGLLTKRGLQSMKQIDLSISHDGDYALAFVCIQFAD
ncbi:MAG: holo-ACP synthase [Eubacteriales bacterium]|nr:holo-ACP synthase [Eubacteriales bacterium]